MPHVAFVAFSGFRVREDEMRELGMSLPGLAARGRAVAQLPALGLLTLAGMLPEDWTCSYHAVDRWDEALVVRLAVESPALVAVSALTASIEEAYRFAERLHRERIPVVGGGLHVSVCSDEAQQQFDAVVVGSAESVWRQILNDALVGHLRPVYRATDPVAAPEWPLPRFDLLPAGSPRYTLQTQRGCPLACSFCGASRLLGGFIEKPLDAIGNELRAICELDPNPLVELADDNTFAGTRDVAALLDCFEDSNIRYFTEADWRIGERPEIVRRLAASGCVQVLMGIESVVFQYPGMGRKQADLERMIAAACAIQSAGVAVNGCFIVGADGETPESLERLTRFLLKCPLADVQVTVQTPFPGTALRQRLEREGRLLAGRGWSHHTLFDVTYRPDRMSVAELERGFRDVLRQVFSREAAARRDALRKDIWSNNARLRR